MFPYDNNYTIPHKMNNDIKFVMETSNGQNFFNVMNNEIKFDKFSELYNYIDQVPIKIKPNKKFITLKNDYFKLMTQYNVYFSKKFIENVNMKLSIYEHPGLINKSMKNGMKINTQTKTTLEKFIIESQITNDDVIKAKLKASNIPTNIKPQMHGSLTFVDMCYLFATFDNKEYIFVCSTSEKMSDIFQYVKGIFKKYNILFQKIAEKGSCDDLKNDNKDFKSLFENKNGIELNNSFMFYK